MTLTGQFMSTLCLTLQGTPLLQPHLHGSEASSFLSDLIPCFSQLPPYWSHQPLDDPSPPHSSRSTVQLSPQMTLLKAHFADLLTPIMRSIHKPFAVWVPPVSSTALTCVHLRNVEGIQERRHSFPACRRHSINIG